MLLQVVADAGDVGRDFDAVGQPDARDFAQRRIRFLGRLGEDAYADTALLRAVLQRRALGLADDLLASRADKLTDGRHTTPKNERRSAPRHLPRTRNAVSGLKAEAWRLKTGTTLIRVGRDGPSVSGDPETLFLCGEAR